MTAEKDRKSNNCHQPYGEGGAAKQFAEDVTEVIGLKLVRGLLGGDNIIPKVIEIHGQYHIASTVTTLGDGEYECKKDFPIIGRCYNVRGANRILRVTGSNALADHSFYDFGTNICHDRGLG